ncbi:MAG: cytochrome B [Proteobacteria bacterium]|jgi:cytochrome b561|nr:MAG: cytochrome B [Pseudomonadota bacterium]
MKDRYGSLTIALHWAMLLLFAAVYATVELHEAFPKGSDPRKALMMWHFMLGLSVLALVIVRLAARLVETAPPITPAPPAWQTLITKVVHGALYALMIAMPILGWLMLSAEAKPIPFFGLELPALIGPDKELGETFEEIHETIGTIGYYLIGLHAAAALFHHYIVRDNTLIRMMPRRG